MNWNHYQAMWLCGSTVMIWMSSRPHPLIKQ
jgi:hypothetical protein